MSTVLAVGSTKLELEDVERGVAHAEELRKRDERRLHRKMVSVARLSEKAQMRREAEQEYGFGAYRALDGFSDADMAENLLRQLASDPGIRGVMEKRRYKLAA